MLALLACAALLLPGLSTTVLAQPANQNTEQAPAPQIDLTEPRIDLSEPAPDLSATPSDPGQATDEAGYEAFYGDHTGASDEDAAGEDSGGAHTGNAVSTLGRFADSYEGVLRAAEQFYRDGELAQALEAVQLAQDMIVEEYGDESRRLVVPTQAEARMLFHSEQYLRAADSFENVIALIELSDGVFSSDLIGPLTESAVALREVNQHDEAVARLRRAKFITHRDQGIMNLDQIPIIDSLTETLMAGRELLEADREQRFAMQVYERRYGDSDPEVVEGLYRLARWYRRTGQYPRARQLYRRAIGILEQAFGLDDLRLVEPLRGLAATYQLQGTRRGEGEKSLLRAVGLFERAENADLVEYAENLIALGDWYLLTSKRERAQAIYVQAWNAIVESTGTPDRAQVMLGVPTRLRYVPPNPSQFENIKWTTEEHVERYVDAFFTVTADGTVADIEVASENAPHRVKREVRKAVGTARYRPRLVDGVPVDTDGVQLRQVFFVE